MFTVNHLDQTPDAGFLRAFDARSAQRQFQVSVALILILALAVLAVAALAHFDPSMAGSPPLAKAARSHIAKAMLDIRS